MDSRSVDVERGPNGCVRVRVRSREHNGVRLPDAVFTFHFGDPQFEYWVQMLDDRECVELREYELQR